MNWLKNCSPAERQKQLPRRLRTKVRIEHFYASYAWRQQLTGTRLKSGSGHFPGSHVAFMVILAAMRSSSGQVNTNLRAATW
jgi:hypothetical protein